MTHMSQGLQPSCESSLDLTAANDADESPPEAVA
jgi:hypothetical protein